ncbi:aspartate--ammonia ligase [Taibaiella chishuiensis]|uniref:Aspartate--ammonia ligase n=1 Tax=Taibaiella chishuiensis TaxID=1434707 RepID=A0A2P8D4Q1_9BACT|nr:aspartate--ammonia ligase [Taibaiella chishuiensis]PSK92204.1 aspartate-ammonia ligase [Taibaiella chishuiensis]
MLAPAHKIADLQTEMQIGFIKQQFLRHLSEALHLHQVFAPLFVSADSGINDDLNGTERPVSFSNSGKDFTVVHSLAKWKRLRLAELSMPCHQGIVTHMIALRPDEQLSPMHAVLVDQWDWEVVIRPEDRHPAFLQATVLKIYKALRLTCAALQEAYPGMRSLDLPEQPAFIHSEALRARYPQQDAKAREDLVTREHGAVFLQGIGHPLSDGQLHDDRAPDYDDWSTETTPGYHGLNGDLLVWHPVLQRSVELSSMGIRVNAPALREQLHLRGLQQREQLPFHQKLLAGELPDTIGGGIGQSRLALLLLQLQDIKAVQYTYN